VAQAVLDLCSNRQKELAMPRSTAVLSRIVALMPWLRRLIQPVLERKGARVKRRLKAQAKQEQ